MHTVYYLKYLNIILVMSSIRSRCSSSPYKICKASVMMLYLSIYGMCIILRIPIIWKKQLSKVDILNNIQRSCKRTTNVLIRILECAGCCHCPQMPEDTILHRVSRDVIFERIRNVHYLAHSYSLELCLSKIDILNSIQRSCKRTTNDFIRLFGYAC